MEFLIILFLIFINGIFAMAETALVSSKRVRLEDRAKKGSNGARVALNLLGNLEEFLSAVQIGITLIGIIAGAYGGAAWVNDISPFFEQFESLKNYSVEISYIIIVSIITYLSIIIGELVPKSIAYNNPEKLAIALAPAMRILSIVTTPVVKFLSFSTKIIVKILGIKPSTESPVTEEELKIILEQGSQLGTFDKTESEIIKSIFRFGDRKAYSVMISRQDIAWIDINDGFDEIREIIKESNYSQLLLCDGSLDSITGVIKVKNFYENIEMIREGHIRDFATEPLFIPDNMPALKILDLFREKKIHLAIVVDEHGSVEGMITLHDLFENVFGELPEISDKYEQSIFKREDGSFLVDGGIQIDELKERLDIEFDHPEKYSTLGGYVMFKLAKVPRTGDKFSSLGFNFEVVDMDGNRIDKVMIQKNAENS